MIKREFEESKQFLHLADNESLGKTDRFVKVRPLLDLFILFYLYFYPPDSQESDGGANT